MNAAIETINIAKEASEPIPVKGIFGSIGVLLTMIRVSLPLIHIQPQPADVDRIQRPTKLTTSNWVWLVQMFAPPLTGD